MDEIKPTFSRAELAKLLDGELLPAEGASEQIVSFVSQDSNHVSSETVFVAVKGHQKNGEEYIKAAHTKGAPFVVTATRESLEGIPGIVVKDTRRALSTLAALFAREPSAALAVVGVTGTNGKSTTAWIIHNLLSALAKKSILMGTIGCYIGEEKREGANLTTPDPIALHKFLRLGRNEGCSSAVLEVSSHALDQKRVEDINFACGVFTNLSRDHLDYHQTMEEYFRAKKRLFDLLEAGPLDHPRAVICADDPYGRRLAAELEGGKIKVVTYGVSPDASLQLESVDTTPKGSVIRFNFKRSLYEVHTPYLGLHNALNSLAALAVIVSRGLDDENSFENLLELMKGLPQVPGRLERIPSSKRTVFVDYAHSPDALQHALTALRPLTQGKLWAVFGCGGDRDKGKRPEMGRIAQMHADRVIVTSDNPRTEDPARIIHDILEAPLEPYAALESRSEAIAKALHDSTPEDVILIAGKGHEDYQIIGTEKQPFSDQLEVMKILETDT